MGTNPLISFATGNCCTGVWMGFWVEGWFGCWVGWNDEGNWTGSCKGGSSKASTGGSGSCSGLYCWFSCGTFIGGWYSGCSYGWLAFSSDPGYSYSCPCSCSYWSVYSCSTPTFCSGTIWLFISSDG